MSRSIKSITVLGRRWFDKVNGNTYCSAEVFFDGVLVAQVPFEYGYGNYYMQAAVAELVRNKLIKLKEYESLWQYCDRKSIVLVDSVTDGLKRKLLKNRTLNLTENKGGI